MSKTEGLFKKYKVERLDGKELTPCLVMEVKNKHARKALITYAESVQEEYPILAHDVFNMVREWKEENE